MANNLDATFAALADPSRRLILERLARGPATVGEVAAPLDMTPPSVSRHVKLLEEAALVVRRVSGRQHWLDIDPAGFRAAVAYLGGYSRFWELSLERLGRLGERLEPDAPERAST